MNDVMQINYVMNNLYWVARKVRADFEGKLKHRRFKFY